MINDRTAKICLAVVCIALLWATAASGYDRYKDPVSEEGNCSTCHGDFTDGTSPQNTQFPFGDKHEMHRSSGDMNAECDLCHTSGDGRNPFIGSSDGTNTNPGIGCVGCHGREADMGNDGISAGRGAGLRQHHTANGVGDCMTCHTDADPGNYTPVGEDFFPYPEYYGDIVDSKVDEPCNSPPESKLNENWSIGDFQGQDIDGDNLYDFFDHDCRRDGAELIIDGACPGVVSITIAGQPNASLALIKSSGIGSFTVPGGGCAGEVLDLSGPGLLTILQLSPGGDFSASPNLGAGLCGQFIQTIDLGSCGVGNVAQIPE